MNRLAVIAATAALAFAATPVAAAPTQDPVPRPKALRPCLTENDAKACVWDAKHMGNGLGSSFLLLPSGRVVYIKHSDAHRLVKWVKP